MPTWFKKITGKPPAPTATVWMATPSGGGTGPARTTTVNRETLRYLELFFGGFCLFLLGLAVASRVQGITSTKSLGIILAFVLVNILFFHLVLKSQKPLLYVLFHPLVGGVLCPLAYLWVDGNLAPWWPGFFVMCLSGVILVGLITETPKWGRLLVLYYLAGMVLVAWWAGGLSDGYATLLRGGMLLIVGMMLAQIMAILSQSLSKIYERSVKLKHAKEDLEELANLKTEFFANVSHEFRTPITLTIGPLEGVLRGRYGEINDTLRNQLQVIVRNQQRLLGLINQILDAAKVEAGMAELKATPLKDMNRFVGERAEQFRAMAVEKALDFVTIFDPLVQGMEIYVDKDKFDKILFNLLSNAIKFTKQGSIRLVTEMGGNQFILRVTDTGAGIPEEQLPLIFERFRQARSGAEQAGTGIGLHLVREFVKLHGGEVRVKSRVGKGTTFEVLLPLGKSHLPPGSVLDFSEEEREEVPFQRRVSPVPERVESDQELEVMHQEALAKRDSAKATVLYVDDNPDLRHYIRDLLLPIYNVFLASQGKEGLERAKEVKPDLILSDLMMPVMDGLELCRAVRQEISLQAIPFVLLTAKSLMESKLEGLEYGADDYLIKPFSEIELLSRVKNLISLRKNQVQLKRELEAARAIQQSLLPTRPQKFQGATLDYLYHPSQELSGDFCDILGQGEWIYFYLADVTSHGTASAQVTYLLKGIFSHAVEGGPSSLLDLMKEAGRQYSVHRLAYDVGIQLGRYHPATRRLEYCRGNAPPAIRVQAGGHGEAIRVQPLPPLTSLGGDFSQSSGGLVARLQLEAGDSVFLYTDGCFEFPMEGREFGKKRLYQLLETQLGPDWGQEVLEKLSQARGGGIFPDDLTVLRLIL